MRTKVPSHERWAVAPYDSGSFTKTLLLFDRVFAPDWSRYEKPGSYGKDFVSDCAKEASGFKPLRAYEAMYFDNALASEAARKALMERASENVIDGTHSYIAATLLRNVFVKAAAKSLVAQGVDVTTFFYADLNWNRLTTSGRGATGYEAALENVAVVKPPNDFKQIAEFRSDEEAVIKFRDLRLWLEYSLKAESASHASEIIAQKLADYEWAIKKHGFQTGLGIFNQIIDWKNVAAYGTAATAGGYIYGEVGAALAGGLVIVAQTVAKIAECKISRLEQERGDNREVAALYEITRQFG